MTVCSMLMRGPHLTLLGPSCEKGAPEAMTGDIRTNGSAHTSVWLLDVSVFRCADIVAPQP